MIGRISVERHITLFHTLGLVVSEKNIFSCIFIISLWPVWTPGAWLAGFINRNTIHCYTQNMKALGLVILEKIFYVFPIVSLWKLMTPGMGPFLTPGE